jgi:hypothetical protein
MGLASKDLGVGFTIGVRDLALIKAERKIVFDLVKSIPPDIVANLRKAWRESIHDGLDRREFISRVVSESGIKGIRGLTVKERVDMIARTEISRTYNTAGIIRDIERLGPDHKRKWISVMDSRTETDSLSREGKILPVSEWRTRDFVDRVLKSGGGGFRMGLYHGFPPLRPMDRCTTKAVPEGIE